MDLRTPSLLFAALLWGGCSGGDAPQPTATRGQPATSSTASGGDDARGGKSSGKRSGKSGKSGGKSGKSGEGKKSADVDDGGGSVNAGGGEDFDVSGAKAASGATVEKSGGSVITRLKSDSCVDVTATPLALADQIVVVTHAKSGSGPGGGCKADPDTQAVYAVSAKDGAAKLLVSGADGEATPTWADGTLFIPLINNGGGLAIYADGKGWIEQPIRMAMDSSALWDGGNKQLIVGTVNSPQGMCQSDPLNGDCGVLAALDSSGKVRDRLDMDDSFRAWISAAPTSDGRDYFVGSGSAMAGQTEQASYHPCEVLKVDKDLKIGKTFDDGDPGCKDLGQLKSAPVGEIPVVDGSLWVQYLGPTDSKSTVPLVKLDASTLKQECKAEIPGVAGRSAVGFYQAPVIDEQGRAFFVTGTDTTMELIRVESNCQWKSLARSSSRSMSAPTLADDKYVLVSEPGKLLVVDRESGKTTTHALASNAHVTAGAVITEYGVTVVSGDATVTTLTDTGIKSYGSAPWPRFRRDNVGSAGAR